MHARCKPQTADDLLWQAWMPSTQVCSNRESPASPHLLNQAPPREQQLRLPDFLLKPHLGHCVLLATDVLVAVDASVDMRPLE